MPEPARPLGMQSALTLRVHGEPPQARVRVGGELDVLTAPRLDQEVVRLLALGYREIALDLAGLSFVAAGGLSALTRADGRCRAVSGRLLLTRASPGFLRLLALTGLDATLTVG